MERVEEWGGMGGFERVEEEWGEVGGLEKVEGEWGGVGGLERGEWVKEGWVGWKGVERNSPQRRP